MRRYIFLFILILFSYSYANKADVIATKYKCNTKRVCTFQVTIKHGDEGWKHYANSFTISTIDDKIIATRILHHPHVNEQPFTRSISNVHIPKDINKVLIQAHDSRHKELGQALIITIPK